MRGLQNLALTLNEAGRFPEALTVCDRLVDECGDEVAATWHRAAVYLTLASGSGRLAPPSERLD
jgi:hypothetical protein